MDNVPDGAHLRLRSRVHAAYLSADEDGVGVSLRSHGGGASMNEVWRLQRFEEQGRHFVVLQGAAYGRYLANSFRKPPTGHRGRRAVQRDFAEDFSPLMWSALAVGGGFIRLRHEYDYNLRSNGKHPPEFDCNLRANGRHRFWNTSVTVDLCGRKESTMMHWKVEVIPQTQVPPPLPLPTEYEGGFSVLFRWLTRHKEDRRTIRHVRADDEGRFNRNHDGWDSFPFYGRSIYNLRAELGILEPDGNIPGITICVRPGWVGRLTPLVTDLPRSEDPLDIVVLTTDSPGTEALRYPDFDAPAP